MRPYSQVNSSGQEDDNLSPLEEPDGHLVSSIKDEKDLVSSIVNEDKTGVTLHLSGINELVPDQQNDQSTEKNLSAPPKIRDARGSLHQNGQSKITSFQRSFRKSSWTWEIAAASFSLLMSCLTILILGLIDNKQLPNWPLGVTPNALISILTVCSKSTLVYTVVECIGQLKWVWFVGGGRAMKDISTFDNASRGPAGSLLLLCTPQAIHFPAIGALIIVLAVATEPFNQQILTYTSKPSSSGSATAPYAIRYQSSYSLLGSTGTIPTLIDPIMFKAVYQGLYGSESDNPAQTLPVNCPTGNCTWNSEVVSLGICSDQADVTTDLQSNCPTGNIDHNCNFTFTLPNGLNSLDLSKDQVISLNSYRWPNQSTAFTNYDNFLSGFTVITTLPRPDLAACQITAFDYVWFVCAQSINISVTNGVISQHMKVANHTGFYPPGYSDGDSPPSYFVDYCIIGPGLPASSSPQTYNYSLLDLTVLSYFLQNLTQGVGYGDRLESIENSSVLLLDGKTGMWSQISVQILYAAQNITDIVLNMATLMTNVIRTNQISSFPSGVLGNISATGVAYSYQIVIKVHWSWLILSLVLVFSGLGFLFGTILISRRKKTTLWKNSALALLMHGFDSQLKEDLGSVNDVDEMEDVAERTILQLQVNSNGLKHLGRVQ